MDIQPLGPHKKNDRPSAEQPRPPPHVPPAWTGPALGAPESDGFGEAAGPTEGATRAGELGMFGSAKVGPAAGGFALFGFAG